MSRSLVVSAVGVFALFCAVLCGACGEKSSPQVPPATAQRPQRDFRELLGKDLSKELSAVVPAADMGQKPAVLFLYNRFDCFSCMRSGFYLAGKIDSLSGRQRVFVVGIMANQGKEQEAFGYRKYIYSDPQDTIRRKLRYVPTPILIGLDSCDRVKSVLLVRDTIGSEVEEFLASFLK